MWPLVEPKSAPSGTMMAHTPPGASDSIASPRKSSSLFLDCVGRSLRMDSAGSIPANGGFIRTHL